MARQRPVRLFQELHGRAGRAGLGSQQCDGRQRRQCSRPAFRQCGTGKRRIALAGKQLQQRMVRMPGLNGHSTRPVMTPGAPGDLDDQLGHAFAGAEVGAEQAVIGIQDTDQGDLRE